MHCGWCALPRGAVLASARFLGRHFEHIFGRIQKIGMSAVSSCGTMGYPDVSDLYNNYARWRRREREREMYLIGRPCVLGRSPHVESPRRCDPNLGPSGPKALTVFKNFSACGAARCTVGPSGPNAPVVLKKFSACGAARCTVGPSGPKAQVVFKIFSACGAARGTVGPSGPKAPVVFKIFSACGAARCIAGPSIDIPAPKHRCSRWCSKCRTKAPVVFKMFSACGAARYTVGPSGPKAQVVFKIFSACGAAGGTKNGL